MLALIDVVTLLICLCGGYLALRRNPRLKHHLKTLGGPPGYPLLGSALSFLRPHSEFLPMINTWQNKYGKVFGVWIGNFIPYVFCGDAVIVEKLLSSSSHIDKGANEYKLLHDWLGLGLLTAPRQTWFPRRKLLTPSFHFKILEDFVPIFNEQASVLLNCLKNDRRENTASEFNLDPYLTRCTLDIICETAMGKKIQAQTSTANKKYIDAVNGMCRILIDKNFQPWLRVQLIYKLTSMCKREAEYLGILRGFTDNVILARKEERVDMKSCNDQSVSDTEEPAFKVYGGKRKAFLDLLLDHAEENPDALSDTDICDEVNTFMFEGHDTTGANLAWSTLMLAIHQECQEKVHQELDEVFGDNPSRDVTMSDLSKLKYLECCIKETLRLHPSVPMIFRQVDAPGISLENGKLIPEGATACAAIYFVHRNPEYFPNPLVFKPERFSTENSAIRHPFVYIPFSAGPRNCIGQKFALIEEKIILAKLFRTYKVTTSETTQSLIGVPDIVLRCSNGVNVTLKTRN